MLCIVPRSMISMKYNTILPIKSLSKEGQGILFYLDNQVPKDKSQRSDVWLSIRKQQITYEKLLLMPAATYNPF